RRAAAHAAVASAPRGRTELGRLHRRDARPDARARRGARRPRSRRGHRLQRPRVRDGADRRAPGLRADRRRQDLARRRRPALLALRRRHHRPPAERPVTRAQSYAIALDVGGTFTDVTLREIRTGRLWITKTPTTPGDPSEGFMAGIDKALALSGVAHAA